LYVDGMPAVYCLQAMHVSIICDVTPSLNQ